MKLLLIGAGGNAKTLIRQYPEITAYADLEPQPWTGLPRVSEEDLTRFDGFVLGIGGVTPEQLRKRLSFYGSLVQIRPAMPSAIIKEGAKIEHGAIIGHASLINTGAIICHDAIIGCGSHVAPGAIVLGGAHIGECCMIGAGAVVLPGSDVPDNTLVKANSIYSVKSNLTR